MTETDHLKELTHVQLAGLSKQIDATQAIIESNLALLERRIDHINQRITQIEGKSTGHGESWAFFVAAGGMVLAAISTFAFFMK